MLRELMEKMNENYAVKALRKLEDMTFETKEVAEEVYNTMFLVLKDDLIGIDIRPEYYQSQYITVSGPEIGKRGLHWNVRLDMRKYYNV